MPSPESALIRSVASVRFGDDERSRLGGLAEQVGSWERVFYEGHHHGLLPMLYARLRSVEPRGAVPGWILTDLQRTVSARTAMALFLTSEMATLGRALDGAGIRFLVLKGPSLAEAYGGIAFRPFVDNDLLIERSDYARLDALLLEMGFQHRIRAPLQRLGYLYIHGEDTFVRRRTGQTSTVDVHTALVPPGLSFAPSLSSLLGRGRRIAIGGLEMPVLSWEDLLLTLAVNGHKDQWHRLRLATDIASVAAMVSDWPEVFARAREGRCLRILHIALLIAASDADAALPPDVRARVQADPQAVRLAAWLSRHLAHSADEGLFDGRQRARLNLGAQDGIAQRVRYLAFVTLRRLTEWYIDPKKKT